MLESLTNSFTLDGEAKNELEVEVILLFLNVA